MGGPSGLGSARMISRKSLALVSLLAVGCPLTWAQSPAPAAQPQAAAAPAQTAPILQRIVLVEQGEAGDRFQPTEAGDFVVTSPGLSRINVADLNSRLAVGKGQPITEQLLAAITQVIETAIRPDFPLAAAVVLPQKVDNGVLRVTIVLLKVRDIKFVGNRWFSNSLLQNRLQVSKGEIIQISDLDQGLKLTNNSPFRRVQLQVDQIPNTNEANLIFGVEDKLPLKLVLSGDDGGNKVIGYHRVFASLSYGNVFGKEHEATYTLVTTDKTSVYKAHALNYRIPLANFKSLQFSGAVSEATPTLFNEFNQKAESTNADIRFTMPVRTGANAIEAFANVSFKRSNNDLDYSATNILSTVTDIFQATIGTSAIWRDKQGAWALSLSATGSPGGINSRNTDKYFGGIYDANGDQVFEGARQGAEAQYAFATLSIQRYQALPLGMELSARGTFQAATTNLLPSEQISIGGANSVRGYGESTSGGDKGFVLNLELMSPTMRFPLPRKFKKFPFVETRVLGFFDAGDAGPVFKNGNDRIVPPLTSVGFGIRAALPGHMSLVVDYGFQLTEQSYLLTAIDPETGAVVIDRETNKPLRKKFTYNEDGRGHVKLVIAF